MKKESHNTQYYITDKTAFTLVSKSPFFIDRAMVTDPKHTQHYHYHNCYELYYLYSGERYYFIKNKTYHVTRGNLILIKDYDIHCTTNCAKHGYDRMLINFKKEFMEGLLDSVNDIDLFECFKKDVHIIRLDPQEQHFIEQLLRSMHNEFKNEATGYLTYLKTALIQLLTFTNRHNDQLVESNTKYANSTHKTISEITGYINSNYTCKLSLSTISAQFFISPYYLSRTFKNVTGYSFIDYLNYVRIKEAQKLLRRTDLTIAEIAESVGYTSSTHFGRTFRKITGMSPLSYRKYH